MTSTDIPTFSQIKELIRVWILQFVWGTTSSKIFNDSEWYSKGSQLNIRKDRYLMLFKKLGDDKPLLDTFVVNMDDEVCNDDIWGQFDQYNDVLIKIERIVGDIGKCFVFNGCFNATIDDDKLRHSSGKFREEGLQMTGFRGSRIGPVMNGLGLVESGLILSIRFSRHRDNA